MSTKRFLKLVPSLICGILAFTAPAVTADEFRLEAASLPRPILDGDKPNVIIEASAVEPIGDGHLLLIAHDKDPALHVVDASTGKLMGDPITSPMFPVRSLTGPKWEGMARDGDGNFYLIGAHNGKTDEERATKSVLLRFRLKDSETPAIDDGSVIRWDIKQSLVAALKSLGHDEEKVGKRKIEGLAIRDLKDKNGQMQRLLVIGLREPGDKVRTFAADITMTPPADAELALKPLFSFEAESREGVSSNLTSLEYSPKLGGFLVVTATEDTSNVFHGNTLWFVADEDLSKAHKVGAFEVAMKAEGLAVLDNEPERSGRKAVKLLVTFDNDPHATKIPSRFQTVTLVRETR